MSGWVSIEADYGPVGSGYSRAHYVLGDDAVEYAAKGPSFVKKFRHIAANEIVAAGLASRLNLPVPDWRVLKMGKRLFFGSRRVPDGKYHPAVDKHLFAKCDNSDLVYDLAVFDTWICNKDRHEGNLWALCSGDVRPRSRACTAPHHSLVLIDHDMSLLPDDREPSFFRSCLMATTVRECITLPFIRMAIVDPSRLGTAIGAVESILDSEIDTLIASVPEQLLSAADRASWVSFLIESRGRLRQKFNSERSFFNWLNAGAI